MSLDIYWSSKLELLAEKLFEIWEERASSNNIFSKFCVVYGDEPSANWLKNYFLYNRARGKNKILANIEYVSAGSFVNDWLAAQVKGRESYEARDPRNHPYSKEVLSWRLYNIFGREEFKTNDVFSVLNKYIGNGKSVENRKIVLASKLAKLYDDYLNYRFRYLRSWESGGNDGVGEKYLWQAELYRMLLAESDETYVKDYNKVFSGELEADAALKNGFPKYDCIFVFDVSVLSWPFMGLLNEISKAQDVVFFNFNPTEEYWFDVRSTKGELRDKSNRLLRALRGDEGELSEFSEENDFIFEEDRSNFELLSRYALGGRGVLVNQLDMKDGDYEYLGETDAFEDIKKLDIQIHSCYSTRRELETVRNGLHDYFVKHPDVKPYEVVVLVADWTRYAPLIESVFSEDVTGRGVIPISLEGGVEEYSLLLNSFNQILDFGRNRFEFTSVFGLLSVKEIYSKFGLNSDDVETLHEIISSMNIHWGYDQDDVNRILGQEVISSTNNYWGYDQDKADKIKDFKEEWEFVDKERPSLFTWRYGFDRLALDALIGDDYEDYLIKEFGTLKNIVATGKMEGDRLDIVSKLYDLVEELNRVRKYLQEGHTIDEWNTFLLKILQDFYEFDGGSIWAEKRIAKEINTLISSLRISSEIQGNKDEIILAEVIVSQLTSNIGMIKSRVRKTGNAVKFAPLRASSATPAKLVWICGINDGVFPRNDNPLAFDLIWKHRTMFDVGNRDRDNFSFLKAIFSARESLCFSYIGKDIKTNKEVPESVALKGFKDWLARVNVTVREHIHPLQSYSKKYYEEGSDLPTNYSKIDFNISKALFFNEKIDKEKKGGIAPFKKQNKVVLDFGDVESFFDKPITYILKSLNANEYNREVIDFDSEKMDFELTKKKKSIIYIDNNAEDLWDLEDYVSVAKGDAPDTTSIDRAYSDALNSKARESIQYRCLNYRKKDIDESCFYPGLNKKTGKLLDGKIMVSDCYEKQELSDTMRLVLELEKGDTQIDIFGMIKFYKIRESCLHHIYYPYYDVCDKQTGFYNPVFVLRHLFINASGFPCTTIGMRANDSGTFVALFPMNEEEAIQKLRKILRLLFIEIPNQIIISNRNVKWENDSINLIYDESVLVKYFKENIKVISCANMSRTKEV